MKRLTNKLFEIYIYLLPFGLFSFLKYFKNLFSSSAAINNDLFLLLAIILMLIIINKGKIIINNPLIKELIITITILIAMSFLTSSFLYYDLGELYGENSFSTSFPSIVYYMLIGATFFVNSILFEKLDKKKVETILDKLCLFEIILGIIQLVILYNVLPISSIYDSLDIFSVLADSNYIKINRRICLSGSEPSSVGMIANILLLPYLLGQITFNVNKKKYIFYSAILTFLCFFTASSTVYVAILVNYSVYIVLNIRNKKGVLLILFLFIGIIIVVLGGSGSLNSTAFGRQVYYLLLEKTTSSTNYSTAYRYSTIINDFRCFVYYPITGIGNGNQGFLYPDTMASDMVTHSMIINSETQKSLSGVWGVLNGGAFIPSYVSGYGLIGVVLLYRYIKKCRKIIIKAKPFIGCFYDMYFVGGITFLCIGIVSVSIESNFLVMFVCSIPYLAYIYLKKQNSNLFQQKTLKKGI